MSDDNTATARVNNISNIAEERDQWESSPGILEPGFKSIPNKLLNNDYGLSIEALGMICYLLHHKPGFKVHESTIMRVLGIGRDRCRKIFSELREKGFVKKIRLREKGRFNDVRAMYSNHPEFLESNKKSTSHKASHHKPENQSHGKSTICLKIRPPETPSAEKPVALTILRTNNTSSSQDQDLIPRTTTRGVVLFERLINLGFTPEQSKALVEQHGEDAVIKITDACERGIKNISAPVGWILKGLKSNWVMDASISKSEPRGEAKTYSREDNVSFFNSLPPARKLELYDEAITKAPFRYHEPPIILKEDVLGDFSTNSWFKAFMSVLGRDES